jgi:ribosomal protein L29
MKLKLLTVKELRTKKAADVSTYVAELRQNYVQLQHAIATNKDKQTHQLGQIKKAVARAHTIMNEQAAQNDKENK